MVSGNALALLALICINLAIVTLALYATLVSMQQRLSSLGELRLNANSQEGGMRYVKMS